MISPVTVLGAGSWGTALAVHLARVGHDVRLWARDESLVDEMTARRVNGVYLPGVTLPGQILVTHALDRALAGCPLVISAVPSHGCRAVMREARPYVTTGATVVSATKGLEAETLARMSEVVVDELGSSSTVVALSGPSFATEVARQLPTAVVAASTSAEATEIVQSEFRAPYFRVYGSDDLVGVEIGGALKNVIAIAAGVVDGLGLGHNARSALITRGLVEVTRLACAAGGRRETLAGLSGLGDLVLTCTGDLSRNRRVGMELARGKSLAEILAGTKMVAEGVRTTAVALELGARYGVELPIATQMAEVLAGRADVRTATETLMLRRQRAEAEAR